MRITPGKFLIYKQANGRWCVRRPDGECWWGATYWDVYAAFRFMATRRILAPPWQVSRLGRPPLGMVEMKHEC